MKIEKKDLLAFYKISHRTKCVLIRYPIFIEQKIFFSIILPIILCVINM